MKERSREDMKRHIESDTGVQRLYAVICSNKYSISTNTTSGICDSLGVDIVMSPAEATTFLPSKGLDSMVLMLNTSLMHWQGSTDL
jgi:hypothetical protein